MDKRASQLRLCNGHSCNGYFVHRNCACVTVISKEGYGYSCYGYSCNGYSCNGYSCNGYFKARSRLFQSNVTVISQWLAVNVQVGMGFGLGLGLGLGLGSERSLQMLHVFVVHRVFV